jgi:hypothetical protein
MSGIMLAVVVKCSQSGSLEATLVMCTNMTETLQ